MYLERTSFDAVITDKNGLTIEADCQVTEPSAGGLAAEISINIPRSNEGVWHLRNPCSLRGANGIVAIEINELWYRSISAADPQRKHARYTLKINHAKQLTARWSNVNNEQDALRFILSPVRFLKEHPKAKTANYASTQNMTVELFSLQTAELGKIRFSMIWSVHLIDTKGVSAEIRPSFVAEIKNDGTSSFEEIVEKMREVLTALSIFTRQAITLHGWVLQKSEEIHKLWFDPLGKLCTDHCEMCEQA